MVVEQQVALVLLLVTRIEGVAQLRIIKTEIPAISSKTCDLSGFINNNN